MALSRTIHLSFWTDSKIIDDFTPEDRYFYLYLMTNPHTNLCGCYEISMKQMSDETGYSKETVEKLIYRMSQIHKVINFSTDTKEMLLLNWSKYNWTNSDKFKVAVDREIQNVKDVEFKRFLTDIFNGDDTVSIPYAYPMDTSYNTITLNTNTLNTETLNTKTLNTNAISNTKSRKSKKLSRDEYDTAIEERCFPNAVELSSKDWVEYKLSIGDGYTEIGFKHWLDEIAKKLDELGSVEVAECINHSIAREWKGVVWERNNFRPKEKTAEQKHEDFMEMWRNA